MQSEHPKPSAASYTVVNHSLILFFAIFSSYTLFFDIYRGFAFNTIPIDDYAHYLQHIVGSDEGFLPGKPFIFRYLSVAVATPFYEILPLYKFTNLQDSTTTSYLKAAQALSLVSYIAAFVTAAILYRITRVHYEGDRLIASIVFLISLQVARQSLYGVDPIAIMFVAALLLIYTNKWLFSIILLISTGFNEKIVFIFFILTWARLMLGLGREGISLQFVSANIAMLCYVTVYSLWPSPPYEELTTVTHYPSAFIESVLRNLTLKGAIQNLLPMAFLVTAAILACIEYKHRANPTSLFRISDVAVLIAFILICHLLSPVKYNAGRITMYVYPIYLPLAIMYLQRVSARTN